MKHNFMILMKVQQA